MIYILVSCLLMTSCQSVRVEYKYIVPEITFPIFPAMDREVHSDGSWTIPKEDVDLLAEFYIKYQSTVENYKHYKELFEGNK